MDMRELRTANMMYMYVATRIDRPFLAWCPSVQIRLVILVLCFGLLLISCWKRSCLEAEADELWD